MPRGGGNAWRASPNNISGDMVVSGDLIVSGTITTSGSVVSGLGYRIWQYQDFAAPVSSSLTLSAFENGSSSYAFNPGWIVHETAVAVLTDDNDSPPTTTTSIPGRWLPGNRVKVSTHTSDTITLNQTPASTQDVRIFYLVQLPDAGKYPENYTEAPKFVTSQRIDFLDAAYVNAEGDEDISGVKTFKDNVVVSASVSITEDLKGISGSINSYLLVYDNSTDRWVPTDPTFITSSTSTSLGGLVNVDNNVDSATYGDTLAYSGSEWTLGRRDYGPSVEDPSGSFTGGEKYYNTAINKEMRYDSDRAKWLSVDEAKLYFGHSKNTAPGSYYRSVDGQTFSVISGMPTLFSGTVVSIGYTRSDTDEAVFEVVSSGTQVAFLSSSATFGVDNTIDGDFSPNTVLGVRNQSGGNAVSNALGWAVIKWRI